MAFLEGKFFEKNDASLTVQNTISRVDSPNISDPSNDILDLKEDVKKNIDLLSLRQETKDALANLDTRIENIFDTYHLYSNQDRVGLQEKFNASPEAHMLRRELVNLVERQEKDKINAVRNYQFKLNNLQQEIISGGQTPDLSNSSPKINSYFAEGTTNRISTAFSYIQTDNGNNDIESDRSRKALRKMTRIGFFSFLNSKDENFELLDSDYNPKKGEKKELKALKKSIKNIGMGANEFPDAFRKIAQLYHDNPKINRNYVNEKVFGLSGLEIDDVRNLGTLYSKAHLEGNNLPYFSSLIFLLDREIVNNGKTDLTEIFNNSNNLVTHNENIGDGQLVGERFWRKDGKEAMDIIKENNPDMSEVGYSLFKDFDHRERKNLALLIKDYYTNRDVDGNYEGRGKDKKLCKKINENKLWETDLMQACAWTTIDIETYANHLQLAKAVAASSGTDLHITIGRLCDLNADGNVSVGDSSQKSGLQLAGSYQSAVDELGENTVFNNLCDASLQRAEQEGNIFYKGKVQELKNGNTHSLREVSPGLLRYLQETLIHSPMDVNILLRNGAHGLNEYTKNIKEYTEQPENKQLVDQRLRKEITKIPGKKFTDAEIESLLTTISPYILSLVQHITQPAHNAMQKNIANWKAEPNETYEDQKKTFSTQGAEAVGMGVDIPLTSLLKGLSLVPSIGADLNGKALGGGLALARNTDIKLSEKNRIALGISGGAGIASGPLAFVPLAATSASRVHNRSSLDKKNLTSEGSVKTVILGAHVTTLGSFGLHAGYQLDRPLGVIEKERSIQSSTRDLVATYLNDANYSAPGKITEYLKTSFPESDKETLSKASHNLANALSYFGLTSTTSPAEKAIIAKLVGDWYALQWRNEQISGLDRRAFKGIGIGIDFLAGYYPIPSACIQFAKFHNQFFQDNASGLEDIRFREGTGFGNRELSGNTIDDKKNTLNDLLERTANKQQELGKAEIAQVEDITLSPDKKYLVLPKSLRTKNLAQIVIAPSLKGFLKQEVAADGSLTGNIMIPANAPLRLLKADRQQSTGYLLNLGSVKSEKNALVVPALKTIPAEWFVPTDNVNAYPDITTFPESYKKWTKSDFMAKFFPANGKLAAYKNTIEQDFTNHIEGFLRTSSTGTLNVSIDAHGLYAYSFTAGTATDTELKLTIIDQKNTISQITSKEVYPTNPTTEFVDYTSNGLDTIRTALESTLDQATVQEVKTNAPEEFIKFYNAILKGTFAEVKANLEAMLAKTPSTQSLLSTPDYTTLSNSQKRYVFEKCMEKFAYDDSYKTNIGAILHLTPQQIGFVSLPGDGFKPELKTELITLRDTFVSNYATTDYSSTDLHRITDSTLIGYTSFYRSNKLNTGKIKYSNGYALTPMGDSEIIQESMQRIGGAGIEDIDTDQEQANQAEAKKRIIGKLLVETPLKREQLLKTIESKLPNDIVTQYTFKDADLKLLLQHGTTEITLADKTKKIITLESQAIFYLMGQCVNESMGLHIDKITVSGEEKIATTATGEAKPDIASSWMVNTGETSGQKYGVESTRNIGFTYAKEKPKKQDVVKKAKEKPVEPEKPADEPTPDPGQKITPTDPDVIPDSENPVNEPEIPPGNPGVPTNPIKVEEPTTPTNEDQPTP